MTKSNMKPVYAANNPNARIAYFPGGWWELQVYAKLPEGVDRSRKSPWLAQNSRMTFEDAMSTLSRYAVPGQVKPMEVA